MARVLRKSGSGVPILMLTALAEVDDRVAGLLAVARLEEPSLSPAGGYA